MKIKLNFSIDLFSVYLFKDLKGVDVCGITYNISDFEDYHRSLFMVVVSFDKRTRLQTRISFLYFNFTFKPKKK